MVTYTNPKGDVDGLRDGDEYLTIGEVAEVLKLSPKRVRNMMSSGSFVAGRHFFRRRGIGPRFVRFRVEAWLRGDGHPLEDPVPMAKSARGTRQRRPAA